MTVRTGETVLPLLLEAPLTLLGFVAEASNHTLLAQVGDPDDGVRAIYKPRAGERPLWDFPTGTLCSREVAAYEVSAFLGWRIVPPTVLRDGPMGVGSVQLFVPHDPAAHYFALIEDPATHPALARMAVFDLLVNNADRKGSHVLRGEDGHLWGVDHGLTFHIETKLRTVIWDLGGTRIEPGWREGLTRLEKALRDDTEPIGRRLAQLLSPPEVDALALRAGALARASELPLIEARRRPYPWPPL